MKRRTWLGGLALAFCLLAGFALPAPAQEKQTPSNQDNSKTAGTHKMEEVQVTAAFPGAANEALGQSVVPPEDLEVPILSGTLLEPLRNQAGIQITGTSLFGSGQASVRLRGFSETRYRVLLDGMPVQRDGSYGRGPVDWSLFAAEDIHSLTIFRGSLPAKFGNSLGGLIEINSTPPSEKPETRLSAMYGSLGTWSASAQNRWKAGPLGWSLGARQYETDGYLRNNFVENFNFNGNLTLDLPWRMQAGVGLLFSDGKTGLPVYNRPDSPYYDPGQPQSDEKELGGPGLSSHMRNGVYTWGNNSLIKDTNSMLSAFLLKKFQGGQARLRGMLWNQETTEEFYDSADTGKKFYERKTTPEDNNWQVLGDVAYTLGDHLLEVGGETRTYGWGDQTTPYIDLSYFKPYVANLDYITTGFKGQTDCLQYTALYGQDTWKITKDIDLELGLRGEWYETNDESAEAVNISEDNLDPRLALRFRPWQGGEVGLRFGITHRYPNSPEFYWWYLNRNTNYFNTDLSPEKAIQYELGLEQKIGQRASFAARVYYYDISDYIFSTSVSGVGRVVYNIDEVKMWGGELEGVVALPWGFSLWGNLTLQKADKNGDPWDVNNEATNQLPNFPEVMANLGLDYRPDQKLRLGLSLHYIGSRDYLKNKDLYELGSYVLLNCQATYRFLQTAWGNWDALLAAENLLDQDYEMEAGYPMQGFTLMGGVRYTF